MFRRSVDTLDKLDWLAVVFDEVHHFKNPNSLLCGDVALALALVVVDAAVCCCFCCSCLLLVP